MPTVNTTAGATAVCTGNTTTITATGATTYSWTPATGISATTGATITFNGTSTNTYTVTGTDANGCSSTASRTITVNALPTVNTTAGATAVCTGNTTTITATGATTYSWTPATGISATTGATITFNGTSTNTYTVTGTDANGCSSTALRTITVNALPTPTFTANPGSTICTGTNATYTTQSSQSSYIWTVPGVNGVDYTIISGGIGSTSNTVTIQWLTNGSKTVTVNYQNGFGCLGLTDANTMTTVNSIASVPAIVGASTLPVDITYSFTNTTPGGTWTSSDTNVATVDASGYVYTKALGTTNISYSVTNSCGTAAVFTTVTVLVGQWIGGAAGQETNWTVAANWLGNVLPDATHDITIPTLVSYYPQLPASSAAAVRNLNIQSGASLTINTSSVINVKGNVILNGTVNGNGKITMDSSVVQHVSGTGLINSLEINNSAGVSIDTGSQIMIGNTLKLTSGTLVTHDSLTLLSNATYTARIAAMGSGAHISGKVNMQQYVQGGYRRYRFWSHPFNASLSLSQVAQFIDITGQGGSANGFTSTSSNAPSCYRLDPYTSNSSLGYDPGWKPYTDITLSAADSNTLKKHQGIRLFIRGAKGEGLGYGSYTPSETTIIMKGQVNEGRQKVTLQKGAGANQDYNMIGNPYASPVDIGTIMYNARASHNIAGIAYYIWNQSLGVSGQFQTIVIDTTAPDPYYLQANAAFQVRAAHDGDSLIFNESNKGANMTTYLFKAPARYTTFNIYDENYHLYDVLSLNFCDGATDGDDNNFDAAKPSGTDFNFYSLSSDNKKMAIDGRPYRNGSIIPLGISSAYNQSFIIRAENVALPVTGKLFLHDKLLETYTEVTPGKEYKFTISKDAATQGNKRLELVTDAPETLAQKDFMKVDLLPNPATDQVKISFTMDNKDVVSVRVIDMTGSVVYSEKTPQQKTGYVNVSLSNLASGTYLIEVTAGSKTISRRLIKE